MEKQRALHRALEHSEKSFCPQISPPTDLVFMQCEFKDKRDLPVVTKRVDVAAQ